jgi:putative spermidine/putrescine transport system permease protein
MSIAVVVPLAFVFWVSFWRLDGFTLVHAWDPGTWDFVLHDDTFRSLTLRTLEVVGIVLAAVLVVGTMCGYFLARFVRSRTLQTALLLLAIVPFWISYEIRIITWRPLFGSDGLINYLVSKAGLTSQPITVFLYNERAMIFAMTSLYVVFVIGPMAWGFGRVDREVIMAARSLGASPWRCFWTIELPLAKGGMVAGAFFSAIILFSDFATERLIGGAQSPMLAGTIEQNAALLQWPTAAALAIVLTVISLVFLGVLMKLHDLRREL